MPKGSIDQTLQELLDSLIALAAEAEKTNAQLLHHVSLLRSRRATWSEIGAALHVSRQAAWERFANKIG